MKNKWRTSWRTIRRTPWRAHKRTLWRAVRRTPWRTIRRTPWRTHWRTPWKKIRRTPWRTIRRTSWRTHMKTPWRIRRTPWIFALTPGFCVALLVLPILAAVMNNYFCFLACSEITMKTLPYAHCNQETAKYTKFRMYCNFRILFCIRNLANLLYTVCYILDWRECLLQSYKSCARMIFLWRNIDNNGW